MEGVTLQQLIYTLFSGEHFLMIAFNLFLQAFIETKYKNKIKGIFYFILFCRMTDVIKFYSVLCLAAGGAK